MNRDECIKLLRELATKMEADKAASVQKQWDDFLYWCWEQENTPHE